MDLPKPIAGALIGLVAAVLVIIILNIFGRPTNYPVGLIVGFSAGGYIGGIIRQRRGK